MTPWRLKCEEPHTSQIPLSPTGHNTSTGSSATCVDHASRAGACRHVIWPVRAKVLRGVLFFAFQLPLCHATCLFHRNLSHWSGPLAQLSFCKAHWFWCFWPSEFGLWLFTVLTRRYCKSFLSEFPLSISYVCESKQLSSKCVSKWFQTDWRVISSDPKGLWILPHSASSRPPESCSGNLSKCTVHHCTQ